MDHYDHLTNVWLVHYRSWTSNTLYLGITTTKDVYINMFYYILNTQEENQVHLSWRNCSDNSPEAQPRYRAVALELHLKTLVLLFNLIYNMCLGF